LVKSSTKHAEDGFRAHIDGFKLLRNARTEGKLLYEAVADKGEVQDKLHHVALLAIVVFVCVIINYQLVAVGRVDADVRKLIRVVGVGYDRVPMYALDWGLGDLGVIELSG